MKNADSANNVRLKPKLYREAPSAAAPVAPVTPPVVADASRWELKLEDIEAAAPPEDPGRHGI